jgi:hypothetical protein
MIEMSEQTTRSNGKDICPISSRRVVLDHYCEMPSWVCRLLLATTLCLISVVGESASASQQSETKVQEPWAYTHRIDEANHVEFMATTPAVEDAHIWLLLACKSDARVYISLIHSEKFPYALRERAHLTLQLDNSERIELPVAVTQQKLITADPRPTKDLIPILARSNRLSASVADMEGAVYSYSFSLQPNDQALQDIAAHCLQTSP